VRKLLVLLAVVLVVGIAADEAYGYYQGQVNTAAGTSTTPVKFTVDAGETSGQIAQGLYDLGLIQNQSVFLLYIRLTGAGPKLEQGVYFLRKNMTMAEIVQKLQHGVAPQVTIRFVEGWTIHRMGLWLQQNTSIGTVSDFVNAAQGSWPFDFLASRPAGSDLQGYLFPDTYNVDENATVNDVITRQLTEFGQVFTPTWRAEIQKPTSERPAETIENVVILASIAQAEGADPDMPNICSVYYNRLENNMPLQADATILFAQGRAGIVGPVNTSFDSPYNTYLHAGLPPGPIGNPGATALAACVNPPQTDYLYYFTDRANRTHFERTLDQFNADLQTYGVKGS
jgi:UPF0755 protein